MCGFNLEECKEKIVGPYVPLITPFKEDYKIDFDGLRENIHFLRKNGIREGRGMFLVAGAGGEFPSLSVEERKQLLTHVAEETEGKVPLIFSAQHTVLDKVIDLCKHAEKKGVVSVQLSPPYYWGQSRREVYRFYKKVAEKTNVGIMAYHGGATFTNSVGIDYKLMNMLIEIDSVITAKYASTNMYEYIKVLRAFSDRLAIIDNQYWATGFGHMLGAKGFLSACGNFVPDRSISFWELLEEGRYKEAVEMSLQLEIPFYQWIKEVQASGLHGEGSILKPPCRLVGLNAGPARPPYNLSLPEDLEKKIGDILVKADVKIKR